MTVRLGGAASGVSHCRCVWSVEGYSMCLTPGPTSIPLGEVLCGAPGQLRASANP